MPTSSDEMRKVLNQIQALYDGEGRDFTLPDQRPVYDELLELLEAADEMGLHNASDWLRMQLNRMSVHFG